MKARVSPRRARRVHAILRAALEEAVKGDLIPHNPAALADPPKVRQEEIKPLDPGQARTFLRAAGDVGDRHEALYVLSLTAGLRMGEVLGLKWSDVDLDSGTLRVNRQMQRMRRGDGKGEPGKIVFSEPKYASRRSVDLPRKAVEALKPHRKKQLEEKFKAGGSYEDSGLVFATAKGTPLVVASKGRLSVTGAPLPSMSASKRSRLPADRSLDVTERRVPTTLGQEMGQRSYEGESPEPYTARTG